MCREGLPSVLAGHRVPGCLGAAVLFVAVVLSEGALRPGHDPVYHTGSELELGERVFAFAVGVRRTLGTVVGAVLLAIFGFGLGV
jgi:hypothetical protein